MAGQSEKIRPLSFVVRVDSPEKIYIALLSSHKSLYPFDKSMEEFSRVMDQVWEDGDLEEIIEVAAENTMKNALEGKLFMETAPLSKTILGGLFEREKTKIDLIRESENDYRIQIDSEVLISLGEGGVFYSSDKVRTIVNILKKRGLEADCFEQEIGTWLWVHGRDNELVTVYIKDDSYDDKFREESSSIGTIVGAPKNHRTSIISIFLGVYKRERPGPLWVRFTTKQKFVGALTEYARCYEAIITAFYEEAGLALPNLSITFSVNQQSVPPHSN